MQKGSRGKQNSNGNGHGNGSAHKTSVLLVDDDPVFLGLTKRLLETQYGDKVDVVGIACSGEESLMLARLLSPEVVLMDLNMPGMGGLGTIPLLRILFPNTRIIALTHDDGVQARRLVLNAGGYDLIPKSNLKKQLMPAIERRND